MRFFSEHPSEDENVNSEHPVSKTDVRNDSDETSGGPFGYHVPYLVLTMQFLSKDYVIKVNRTTKREYVENKI